MTVAVIDPPEAVLSLAEAKRHLRVDHDEEDDLITGFVAAATGLLDGPAGGHLGRALGRQTLELRRDGFPACGGGVLLPFPPAFEMVAVTYDDLDRAPQTFAPANYTLYDSTLALGSGLTWPATASNPHSARIRYSAGYEAVPKPILSAIKLMLGDLYHQRETTTSLARVAVPMSATVIALLAPFRVWSI